MGHRETIERRAGRSERTRQAVLSAARELVMEGGYRAATVEAIAARARVGKPTIYRRWRNRAAVVMEAMLLESDTVLPFPDTGSAYEDFRRHLLVVAAALPGSPTGLALTGLIGDAQHDPALATAIAEDFIAPLRVSARQMIDRAITRGDIRPDVDPTVMLDALLGPLYYRVLVRQAPPDAAFVETLVEHVFRGLQPQGPGGEEEL